MLFTLLILLFYYALSFGELNQTEINFCYDVKSPKQIEDCSKNDVFNYTSIRCCFLTMNSPERGDTCVPIEKSVKNRNGTFDIVLPTKIKVKGEFFCRGGFLTSGAVLMVATWVIIF